MLTSLRAMIASLKARFAGPVPRVLTPRQQREAALGAIAEAAMAAVVSALPAGAPALNSHFFYGAVGINPVHLTPWYVFCDEAGLDRARAQSLTDWIETTTRAELLARGYPAQVVPTISAHFTSDEHIRASGLNFYEYFNTLGGKDRSYGVH